MDIGKFCISKDIQMSSIQNSKVCISKAFIINFVPHS